MRIIAKLSEEIEFETANGDPLFKGSFHQSLSQLGNILALENNSAQKIRDNYFEIFNAYMETRDSISGVSHDEEGIDLIQYNKAYSAGILGILKYGVTDIDIIQLTILILEILPAIMVWGWVDQFTM